MRKKPHGPLAPVSAKLDALIARMKSRDQAVRITKNMAATTAAAIHQVDRCEARRLIDSGGLKATIEGIAKARSLVERLGGLS